MKFVAWDPVKNEKLKRERNISFEDVLDVLLENGAVGRFPHPNQKRYPNQQVFVIVMKDYAYVVPFVEDDEKTFLKTIFPSRKYTRVYVEKGGS
ncbi:MAG: DUF4258 domain-containing protein [Patescibacteria group bacterium]